MVDKSTSPLQTHFGRFFGHEAVQTGSLFWERGSIRVFLKSTFTNLPATYYCAHIWLWCLSSGHLWQWAREHLTSRPSSVGSSRCHSWRPLSIALRQAFAPSFSWLYECHEQCAVGAYKMMV